MLDINKSQIKICLIDNVHIGGASEYNRVRKWRIKGRWENSCAGCAREESEDIKGLSRLGRRTQLKLFYFHQLICLCYWRDSVALPFVMKRHLFDLLFLPAVNSAAVPTLWQLNIPPKAKLNTKRLKLLSIPCLYKTARNNEILSHDT